MSGEPLPMSRKIREILFKYRTTPLRNGKSPSELYLGRQIRTQLDALRPSKIPKNYTAEVKIRQFSEGERVQAKFYSLNKPSWKFGVIREKLGRLHYTVKLDDGLIFKLHIDQLRSTDVPQQRSSNTQQPEASSEGTVDAAEQQLLQHQLFGPYMQSTVPINESESPSAPATEPPNPLTDAVPSPSQRTSSRQRRPPRHYSDYVRH